MKEFKENAEGVIKFSLNWEEVSLGEDAEHGEDSDREKELAGLVKSLNHWRDIFLAKGIVGQVPERYQGLGFGNLSQRTAQGFLVTGSQTGHLKHLQIDHFSEVIGWRIKDGVIDARGFAKPSSESLTHAAVYEADQSVTCVFHVHSPDIWQSSDRLQIASTSENIEYGSQAMADAVQNIVIANPCQGVLAMKGHEDGIVAYGKEPSLVGNLMIEMLSLAQVNKTKSIITYE